MFVNFYYLSLNMRRCSCNKDRYLFFYTFLRVTDELNVRFSVLEEAKSNDSRQDIAGDVNRAECALRAKAPELILGRARVPYRTLLVQTFTSIFTLVLPS